MARTPVENINLLFAYWDAANVKPPFSITLGNLALGKQLLEALAAMRELVAVASTNDEARRTFAERGVFLRCLMLEPYGITDTFLKPGAVEAAIGPMGLTWNKLAEHASGKAPAISPRQIMLDGIYAAAKGGLVSARSPSGMTSWINAAIPTGAAIATAIQEDPGEGPMAALLKILTDLAIPMEWVTILLGTNTFALAAERLQTVAWSADARKAVHGLAASAAGRARTAAAAVFDPNTLPKFQTGDGTPTPTLPPAAKPWYDRGEFWGAILAGIAGGAALASKPR